MKFIMENAFCTTSEDKTVHAKLNARTLDLSWGKKVFLFDLEYLGRGRFKVYEPSSITLLEPLGVKTSDGVRDLVMEIFKSLEAECVYESE